MKKKTPCLPLTSTLIFFLIISSFLASAQLKLDDIIPVDPAVKIGKLPNGLTYYIRQNKKPEQKVELRLVVNAGSINEDDSQQGLAHMSEHMAFNGTTNFKKNDIVSFLQDIGVGFGNDLNAYTGFDETVYMLPIPTDKPGNLEKGFQVLEDWAHNVSYNNEDIEEERAIILEESRLGKGAEDRMYRQVYPKLFGGSLYAKRLPIGYDSIIRSFKTDEIKRFYREWYRPDLMSVIVVGDVDPTRAESLIVKHFSSLKNPDDPRKRLSAAVPPYASSDAMVVTDKEATSYTISINYPAYQEAPSRTLRDYRENIIKRMFNTMIDQRLEELTQKENPPFLYAYTSFGSYARGYEAFNAVADVGTGDVKKGLEALAQEVERVKRFGFTQAELERAKKNTLTMYERAYNNRDKTESENYTQEYIQHFLQQEATPGIVKEFEYIKSLLPGITIDEVNAVTSVFRDEKNKFVYVMGPDAKQNVLPESSQILAMISETEKADIKAYEEKVLAATLLSKEPKAGKVISKTKNSLLGTTELKLSNGVTVTLKKTDFKNDQIVMGATRAGGKNVYSLADKYNAEYAASIVGAMGIGEFSPTDLRKSLAGQSVSVTPVFYQTSEGFRGNSTNKDIETMFQLLYLYATKPRKDTGLFNNFVQSNKSQFAMIGANPQNAFIDTMYQVFFNSNPKAPVIVPKSEFFDKINLDRSLAIYRQRFGDVQGMNFVFVGSFKEEEIIPLVEKYVASLPVKSIRPAFVDNKVRPVAGKKELVVNKGKEEKSLILSFYTGELPYTEDLELKLAALSEVLNIRIIEELREKVQGIYGGGTFSSFEKYPYPNYSFILQLPCGPEKVDTLLKAVQKEFTNIAQNGTTESYLNKVKKQWIEQYKTSVKENGTWLSKLLDYKLQGSDPRRFIDYEKYVEKLTVKDIQQAAKLVFNGKNQFTAVLMPDSYDGKQLKSAKRM